MKKNLKAENSSNDNYLTNVKETLSGFAARHIGLSTDDINHMLDTLGYKDIDAFTEAVVPKNILNNDLPDIGEPLSEQSALKKLKEIAKKNVVATTFFLAISFSFLRALCSDKGSPISGKSLLRIFFGTTASVKASISL